MARLTQEEFWAKIPHWVVIHPDLDPSAIRVYANLSRRAHNTTRQAFPGIRTIAADIHMSKATVQRALDQLEAVGAVEITREMAGNRHKVNHYHLPISGVPKSDPPRGLEIDPRGSETGTSDGSIIGTQLDEFKNQVTRGDDFAFQPEPEPDLPPRLPGESRGDYTRRVIALDR